MLAPLAPPERETPEQPMGELVLADVYRGMEATVPRGSIKYLRVVEEVRAGLQQVSTGEYRKDHEPFMEFYAAPVDLVSGPYGWPSYVAKQPWGIVPVEEDGSANFSAPAGRQLYFQALDEDLNEVQRMRSVVQLQPGETRSCIGCHEDRRQAPPARAGTALRREPSRLQAPPWGAGPLAYQQAVQPVWDRKCVRVSQCRRQAEDRPHRHAGRQPHSRLVPDADPAGLGPRVGLRLELRRQRETRAIQLRHLPEQAVEGAESWALRRRAYPRRDARGEVLDRHELPLVAGLR